MSDWSKLGLDVDWSQLYDDQARGATPHQYLVCLCSVLFVSQFAAMCGFDKLHL